MRTSWGRWLALGACFLAIVTACVVPVLSFVFGSRDGSDAELAMQVWSSGLALTLGAIGYAGLGYFRSNAGRRDFSGDLAAGEALKGESSTAVILSAVVWIAAIGIAGFAGEGERPVPASAPAAPNRAANTRELPDLVPLGLCFREAGESRQVEIAYANIGKGFSDSNFRLSTANGWGYLGRWAERDLAVPAPGRILTSPYESEPDETRKRVLVRLDEEHRIPDADDRNNVDLFDLPRHSDGTLALPSCGSMRLSIVTHAERIARDGPPNLVPIGLCTRGKDRISVHFTNLGGSKAGLFQISQGRLESKLRIVDAVYNPVPHFREVRTFTIGPLSTLLEGRRETTEYFVKIDAIDAIEEANEDDNLLRERVTRLRDGRVELPDCEALDDTFYGQPRVVADAAAAARAPILPDLVPLGLCFDAGVQVVVGNTGTAKGTVDVFMTGLMIGKSPRRVSGGRVTPWPGAVGKIATGIAVGDAPTGLAVELDPRNSITELDEANNSATFGISLRADGNLDLPDCALVDVRVDHWKREQNSSKGPE